MNYVTITMLAESRVLLLEDSPMRIAWFTKRIPNLKVVRTVQEFRDYFETKPLVDFIFFDHDLGTEETGYDAVKYMIEKFGGNSTNAGIIHTWNPAGAAKMRELLPKVLWIPFGEFEVVTEQLRELPLAPSTHD
jgi:hypothetical protein